MNPENRQHLSEANREALDAMPAAHISHSMALAHAHLAITRPDTPWESLSVDEQAEAVLAAHPWFLAARTIFTSE
jgi:hypothetical protein